WIDDDSALRAAKRDVDDGALPSHPHRERLDLVQRDVWVIADPTLRRSAVYVVLDAITGEHADALVVQLHREGACELALHLAQDLAEPGLELDELRRLIELGLRGAPFVGLLHGRFQICGAHRDPRKIGRFFGVFTSALMIADIPRKDHR